jgi:signal transduction histidine kinase
MVSSAGRPVTERLLLFAFVAVVVAFLGATLTAQWNERTISESAQSIASNSSESVIHLTAMRGQLRRLEVKLDAMVDRSMDHPILPAEVDDIRVLDGTVVEEWDRYRGLPTYEHETALWPALVLRLDLMQRAFGRTLEQLPRHDLASEVVDSQFKPAADRLDEQIATLIDFNAAHGAELAVRIAHVRNRSIWLTAALSALCLGLAFFATRLSLRAVRQRTVMLEGRAAEFERFAERVAHDLRGPIGTATLTLHSLLGLQPAAARERLGRVERSLKRASSILDSLHQFARAGARPTQLALADVGHVISESLQELEQAASDSSVLLIAEPTPAVSALVSEGVLMTILLNLVGNAIKFTRGQAVRRVTVRARLLDRRVHIEVEDTGPGVPEGFLTRMFEPHERAPGEVAPGLGLGLATVKRLTEAYGGEVGVRSRSGEGACVWVLLPAAATDLPPPALGPHPQA